MADPDHVFQTLCLEAVAACGSDMAAVENYVRHRIDGLDARQRDAVEREFERLFAFRAPNRCSTSH